MKRVIVDYKKLDSSLLDMLVEKYPDGYGDGDIISFRNAQGDWVECIEVTTEDTMYLVKVSKRLTTAMEEYDSDEDEIEINEAKNFEEE
ncbi:hypothetical protein KIM67_16560 [Flagellimonas sp. 389]|uniref:hypothetical protein n=1 Tax=Flagellimonas sp. 389 TaxID=2835862 RepID=UPI001BD2B9E0|nr:hypothetical protein [Flagellimonas sp. 389]MBS9464036.1 hypothetical protein [Flagellimonas sp. 389]